MEIERKWMVKGWPEGLALKAEYDMCQGYISVRPTVRIRSEAKRGGETQYILCFKGKAGPGGLSRQEIETCIEPQLFAQLQQLIGRPLIRKQRRDYTLPDGHTLEVSLVDEGLPTEFRYAEVEYASEEEANAWRPESFGLGDFLAEDVTGLPGQSMGDYWLQTRGEMQ